MVVVGKNKGFEVRFNTESQTYFVFKDGNLLIGNKTKFSEVKSYLD
jgi:hypothetical protein